MASSRASMPPATSNRETRASSSMRASTDRPGRCRCWRALDLDERRAGEQRPDVHARADLVEGRLAALAVEHGQLVKLGLRQRRLDEVAEPAVLQRRPPADGGHLHKQSRYREVRTDHHSLPTPACRQHRALPPSSFACSRAFSLVRVRPSGPTGNRTPVAALTRRCPNP